MYIATIIMMQPGWEITRTMGAIKPWEHPAGQRCSKPFTQINQLSPSINIIIIPCISIFIINHHNHHHHHQSINIIIIASISTGRIFISISSIFTRTSTRTVSSIMKWSGVYKIEFMMMMAMNRMVMMVMNVSMMMRTKVTMSGMECPNFLCGTTS